MFSQPPTLALDTISTGLNIILKNVSEYLSITKTLEKFKTGAKDFKNISTKLEAENVENHCTKTSMLQ